MQGSIQVSTEVKARTPRRWQIVALQALWLVTAVLVVEAWLLGVRPAFIAVSTVCEGPSCLAYQLTPAGLRELESLGLSLGFYARYQLILSLFTAAVYAGMALLIFRARPNDPMALYVSLVLLPFGTFMIEFAETLTQLGPLMEMVASWAPGLTLIGFAILCLVFPDGNFVPRWTKWAAWTWVLAPFILVAGAFMGMEADVEAVLTLVIFGLVAISLVAPIYRYRRISSYTQRQQTKWVIFGLVQLLAVVIITTEVFPRMNPAFDLHGSLADLISTGLQVISLGVLPVTFAIATLRHRLWNVDLVLNRTLVYVPLTSILTVIYTSSVAISQRLFNTLAGEQPQAVAIFTTIVLTATFTPVKNWLQNFVDKHFKEAPGRFTGLKELDQELGYVVLAFDPPAVAKKVVTDVLTAYGARTGALYLRRGDEMALLYATPEWISEQGEVSLLLTEEGRTLGRLLLSQPGHREDYTLEEIDAIVAAATPVVCKLHRLADLHPSPLAPVRTAPAHQTPSPAR